jgi:hypothetical protein
MQTYAIKYVQYRFSKVSCHCLFGLHLQIGLFLYLKVHDRVLPEVSLQYIFNGNRVDLILADRQYRDVNIQGVAMVALSRYHWP